MKYVPRDTYRHAVAAALNCESLNMMWGNTVIIDVELMIEHDQYRFVLGVSSARMLKIRHPNAIKDVSFTPHHRQPSMDTTIYRLIINFRKGSEFMAKDTSVGGSEVSPESAHMDFVLPNEHIIPRNELCMLDWTPL